MTGYRFTITLIYLFALVVGVALPYWMETQRRRAADPAWNYGFFFSVTTFLTILVWLLTTISALGVINVNTAWLPEGHGRETYGNLVGGFALLMVALYVTTLTMKWRYRLR
jgi:hypothetical protein